MQYTNYLIVEYDWGFLEARRNGERAAFASDATRNTEEREEHDRKMDLAAAEEAIFVIGNYQCGFANFWVRVLELLFCSVMILSEGD